MATKRLGASKPRSGGAGVGGGDAGDLLGLVEGAGGLGDGERDGVAVDEGDGGGLAVGEFDGEAEAEARAAEAELVRADLVEETRAVAEQDGDAGDGVPDHVAKAAQAGEGEADLVPIGVEGEAVGRADGEQALGGEGDSAGVGDVELEGWPGASGGGEGDGGFVQLAGVVGVGVDGGDLEGGLALCVEREWLPVERGGDLQGDAGERGFAVVADGEQGANGDLLVGRDEDGRRDRRRPPAVGLTARYPLAWASSPRAKSPQAVEPAHLRRWAAGRMGRFGWWSGRSRRWSGRR